MTSEKDLDRNPTRRSRAPRQSNSFFPIIIFIFIAATVGFYFYVNKSPSSTYQDYSTAIEPPQMANLQKENTETQAAMNSTNALTTTSSSIGANGPITSDSNNKPISSYGENLPGQPIASNTIGQNLELQENGPVENPLLAIAQSKPSSQMVEALNNFYTHLDQQPYMKKFQLDGSSQEHFSKLIQKLVNNPPVVTRETDNLFTLLKNTAHFFRILGKDNILILKGILDREKDSLEDMLKAFYVLTNEPETLQQQYQLTISSEALYDYASFLLNTMGGRLYLFRRDSTSRMAVTYYAILVVDRANSEGDSRHGTDIRPALSSLVEEIENGGRGLRYREEYLENLYDLQEKYNY